MTCEYCGSPIFTCVDCGGVVCVADFPNERRCYECGLRARGQRICVATEDDSCLNIVRIGSVCEICGTQN